MLRTGTSSNILTLGGDDLFDLQRGEIGAAGSRIDVNLGAGNDDFEAGGLVEGESGFFVPDAILHGAVLGGTGDDEFTVDVGGTVVFGVDAGDGADEVNLLGGTIGTVDTLANVDLGDGDDRFTVGGFAETPYWRRRSRAGCCRGGASWRRSGRRW